MARPKALIVGGGSKFGEAFSQIASNDYEIHVVTGSSSDADKVIQVNWNECKIDDVIPHLDQDYDIILFNQNGGGAPNEVRVNGEGAYSKFEQPIEWWNQAYFNNVQLSYYIVKHLDLRKGMKICWMLSPLLHYDNRYDGRPYGGYAGDKAYNAHIMKTFSFYNDASFYGIIPKHFGEIDLDFSACKIYDVIIKLKPELSGKFIDENGKIYGV